MQIEFEVYGEPNTLKRHRTFWRLPNGKELKFPVQYDPSGKDKKTFAQVAQLKAPPQILDCPLEVSLIFHFGRPKKHYRTGKYSDQLKPDAPIVHTQAPDVDNLQKFVFDSLTGVFWTDDKIIYRAVSEKYYSDKPRTVVKIIY